MNTKIIQPLMHMKKGAELGAPLRLTWSCYQNSGKAWQMRELRFEIQRGGGEGPDTL
jgi:7-cyano-7-deazaguanine synthase in queuosine biosynthesis